MRDLRRDKQKIYVSLLCVSEGADEWGNTEDVKSYGEPFPMELSVSGNKGEASRQGFGTDLAYDREMSTHDTACPIDEYSHLWLDGREPTLTHNYIVKAVSKTKHCIRFAIKKVEVS